MTTSNKAVQNIYDDSHDNASSGKIKINDLDTRLYLSGLFNSEVYQVQPISIGFTVQSINLSLLMKKKKHWDSHYDNERQQLVKIRLWSEQFARVAS